MLVIPDLKDELVGAMGESRNNAQAQSNFWGALKSYVTDNLELNGVYAGLTPSGSPDPNSGPHIWRVSTIAATSVTLVGNNNLGIWLGSIKTNLATTLFNSGSEEVTAATMVTMGTPVLLPTCPIILAPTQSRNFENSMAYLANQIVAGILLSPVSALPPAASVSSLGSGLTTFINVI